jgi:endonuclease/exonuclease/phosphatase family metal-dependent hydrolase
MAALTVMTLNVRQPDQDDGINAWENRRDLLVETIVTAKPDLIGTQELFTLQADYILSRSSEPLGYRWIGTGRFGDARDKHVGIFYRASSLQLIRHGDFWLSETPDVPGSASWNILRPRQVTWGCFETKAGQLLYHFNTHFPYRREEEEARRQTAALLLQRIGELAGSDSVLLTADFNNPAGGEIYTTLTEAGLQDAWTSAEQRIGPEGTLNGFGRPMPDRRIDWVLYRAPWRVGKAETIATSVNGVYPSDHYPVVAEFECGGAG